MRVESRPSPAYTAPHKTTRKSCAPVKYSPLALRRSNEEQLHRFVYGSVFVKISDGISLEGFPAKRKADLGLEREPYKYSDWMFHSIELYLWYGFESILGALGVTQLVPRRTYANARLLNLCFGRFHLRKLNRYLLLLAFEPFAQI